MLIKDFKITNYKDLTKEDRFTIYLLFFKENKSMNYIAKFLNRNRSTISRELKEIPFMEIIIIKKLTKNTLEEKVTVICFVCLSTKHSLNYFYPNLTKEAME